MEDTKTINPLTDLPHDYDDTPGLVRVVNIPANRTIKFPKWVIGKVDLEGLAPEDREKFKDFDGATIIGVPDLDSLTPEGREQFMDNITLTVKTPTGIVLFSGNRVEPVTEFVAEVVRGLLKKLGE
jgi:hypothetical protein